SRDLEAKDSALNRRRPHRDFALVEGDDVLDDREAEPGAAARARARFVDAVEALEDPRPVGLGDPGPGVLDLAPHVPVLRAHSGANAALLGVLEGVVEQVREHLLEPRAIG